MKLKELREGRGWSQDEVAEKLGVSKQSILNWENNIYEPKYKYLIAIADLFQVPVDRVLGRKFRKETYLFRELEKYLDKDIVEVLKKKIQG